MDTLITSENMEKLSTFFSTRSELLDFLIMDLIRREDTILGSLTLKIELNKLGIDVAIATIGRNLKMLDTKGWTKPVSNKGRMLTSEGRAALSTMRNRIEKSMLSNEIVNSLEINNFDDLLHVLEARLIVEKEAVRLAAANATEEDFKNLQKILDQHRLLLAKKLDDSHAGLDFHAMIVDAGKNRFLGAAQRLLTFEEHQIESQFESLSVRNHALEYIEVHQQLLDYLKARDANAASVLMEDHICCIIKAVKQEKLSKAQAML